MPLGFPSRQASRSEKQRQSPYSWTRLFLDTFPLPLSPLPIPLGLRLPLRLFLDPVSFLDKKTEGAGEYVSKEKARFYRIPKRSATECASVFENLMKLELIENDIYILGRDFLIEIVSMITRMIRNQL